MKITAGGIVIILFVIVAIALGLHLLGAVDVASWLGPNTENILIVAFLLTLIASLIYKR